MQLPKFIKIFSGKLKNIQLQNTNIACPITKKLYFKFKCPILIDIKTIMHYVIYYKIYKLKLEYITNNVN